MTRPTIHDVAAAAGVSLATVDRVLNQRGSVAAKSVSKVREAVTKTGYVRDELAANMSRKRVYRFVFLLPAGPSSFLEGLLAAIDGEAARLAANRIILEARMSKSFDIAAQVRALQAIDPDATDCVALMATDTPEVTLEVARLTQKGVRIIALIADLPKSARKAYVGADNVVAGRTAGQFMGRFIGPNPNPVLVIAGSLAARDHMERLLGFQQVMRDSFGHLNVLPVQEGYDDPERIHDIARQALTQALSGIYAIGAGNRGLVTALATVPAPRPVVIAHELTATTRNGLRGDLIDLVIDQDPLRAVRRAIALMRDLSAGRDIVPDEGAIPLNIYIKENAQ